MQHLFNKCLWNLIQLLAIGEDIILQQQSTMHNGLRNEETNYVQRMLTQGDSKHFGGVRSKVENVSF